MKRYQVTKVVREKLVKKGITLVGNDATFVKLFSVYDSEMEVFNPPFSSDEISALNLFIRAVVDNPHLEVTLYEIGVFNTDFGGFTPSELLVCTSDFVRSVIVDEGGIEE